MPEAFVGPLWVYVLACVFYTFLRMTSALNNGLVYSTGGAPREDRRWPFNKSWMNMHTVEVLCMWPLVVMLWLLNIDGVHLLAGAMVASPVFKGLINHSLGTPFIDPNETIDVDQSGRAGWELLGIPILQPFYGRGRLIEAGIGVLLFFYLPLINLLVDFPGVTLDQIPRLFGLIF